MKLAGIVLRSLFKLLPLRKRALFYTVRADGRLLENLRCVYDALDADKVVFAKTPPHGVLDRLRSYALLLTSKVVVTDDYLGYLRLVRLRPRQRLVQVWHACGLFKKFALDVPSRRTREEEIATHAQYDAFIVASEYSRPIFANAMGIDVSRVLALGVPRTDLLLDEQSRAELRGRFFAAYPQLAGKKIYAYCPTFRERGGEWLPFDPQINWDELDATLAENEVFVVKRHPMVPDVFFTKRYARVLDLSACPTPELLTAADALVTDYSSVMVEAAMLSLPTVFYCPDFDTYERGFYIDYPDDLPGDVVYSGGELLGAVRQAVADPPLERMERFRAWQTSACDGASSRRVAALIEGYLRA